MLSTTCHAEPFNFAQDKLYRCIIKKFQTSLSLGRGLRGEGFIFFLFLFFISQITFAATSFSSATVNTAQTICSGSTPKALTLTIATCTTGTTAYAISAYEWQESADGSTAWVKAVGGTGVTTLSYSPPALTASKYYRCKLTVTGSMCSTSITSPYNTASVKITVNAVPSITVQPANKTACTASSVTFSLTATGTSLTYQWQKSTTSGGTTFANITSATASTYTFTTSTTASTDNGFNYRCIVSNGSCTATSNAASLTVNSVPVITTNNTDKTVCSGSNATFSVVATGTSLTYQWQSATSSTAAYTSTSYTSTSMSVTGGTNNGYYYKCVVSSGACSTTSTAAKLTVNAATSITTQPTDKAICSAGTATFSVVAAGTGTLTYQWQKCSTSTGSFSNVSGGTGATTATYSFTTATADNGFYYKCVVTGTCGSATSNAAKLTFNTAPTVTSTTGNQTVCSGTSATFTVVASGTSLKYQWQYKTGSTGAFTKIPGAEAASYSTLTDPLMNGYYYNCMITDGCGASVSSTPAILTVNSPTVVTTHPSNQSVCPATSVSFSVAATGTGTLSYQWQKSSFSGGSNYSNILGIGTTSSTYTCTTNTSDDGFNYRCQVTGTCGTVYSNAAKLSVTGTTTAITTQPLEQSVMEGKSAIFTSIASGTSISYQWQRCATSSGTFTNIIASDPTEASAAKSPSYLFTPTCADNGFYYRCQVTGSCGTVNSSAVQLTVQCKLSGTVTLTKSDLAATVTKYYDRIDYTDLTCALQSAKLNVQLDLGDDYTSGIPTANYSATVTVTVQGYSSFNSSYIVATSLQTQTITLSGSGTNIQTDNLAIIDLNPLKDDVLKKAFTDIDYYKITYALASGAPSALRVRTWVDEDYTVNVNSGAYTSVSMITLNPVVTTGNRVTFSWTCSGPATAHTASYVPVPDAFSLVDHYQIQILRIYNLSETNTDSKYVYNNDIDWSKALTLEVEDTTSISLYMAEGTGYYAWQVRPIGNYYDGGIADSRNWGVWSSYTSVSSPATKYELSSTSGLANSVFYITQNDHSKNWIYNRVFTENNRIAEGMNYATGLGQVKQSQRKLAEVDSVLMNAQEYDYVGRPAIASMTAPVDQRDFEYKNKLMQDSTGAIYDPSDFDSDTRVQDAYYPPKTDGATKDVPVWENPRKMRGPIAAYYSDENPDLNIPSAGNYSGTNPGNYPYSRTVYDKLGRAKKVSLFGEEHRMGLYDETNVDGGYQRTVRTYYSSVNDTELMGVFGDMTPADSVIYKIIRVDPNEVATVEYKTMDNKTIATAMVDASDNKLLDDIYTGDTWYTKIISTQTKTDDYSYVKQQEINFQVPGVDVYIDYWLDVKSFAAECVNFCSACDYIVTLYVIREETNSYVFEPHVFTINPAEYAKMCEGVKTDTSYTMPRELVFISDPGNYIFGRKITVNNKINDTSVTRYRDYHSLEIDTLLDTEASKFDEMANLVADDEVSGALDNLYTYIEALPSGASSLCGESKSEAVDLSSSGSGIFSHLGANLGSGSTAASSTSNPDADIWLVSTNYDNYDSLISYTVASGCLEIDVPKIACDWNPCDAIYKTAMPSTSYGYEQSLINAYGGYYDFESMLYDTYGHTSNVSLDGEDMTLGADLNEYGNLLKNYFYDESGNQIYSSGSTWQYQIKISALSTNDNLNYYNSAIPELKYNEDEVLLVSDNPTFKLKIDPDGYGAEPAINISYSYTDDYPSGDLDLAENATDSPSKLNSIIIDNYVRAAATELTSKLAPYDYVVSYSANGTYGTITITSTFSKPLPNFNQSIAMSNVSGLILLVANSPEEIQFNSLLPTTTNSKLTYIITSSSYAGETTKPSSTSTFQYGNGYINAMLNHMLHETVKADDGITDTATYGDCYDVYMVWADFVNNWESLNASKGSDYVPGTNFLQALLDDYGTIYSGFSNHEKGKTAYNIMSKTNYDATTKEYGYGYLEYAYKSFPFDTTINNGTLYHTTTNQEAMCAKQYGIKLQAQPKYWTDPVAQQGTGASTWDETNCGGGAWWDVSSASVIADQLDDSIECKAWKNFYGCINSDFESVDSLFLGDDATYSGSVTDDVINKFSDKIIANANAFLDKRKAGIQLKVRSKDAGISKGHAGLYADLMIASIKSGLTTLSIVKDKSTGLVTGVGKAQVAALQNMMQYGIDITVPSTSSTSSNTPTGYTFVKDTTYSKGSLLADWLNNKLGSKESITTTDINSEIQNFATEFGLSHSENVFLFSKRSSTLSGATATTFSKKTSSTNLSFSYSSAFNALYLNNAASGTANLLSGLSPTADIISTKAFNYKFNGTSLNTSLQAIGTARTNFKFKTCDARNITYVYNAIQDALSEAKDCRLENSLGEYDTQCTLKRNIKDSLKIRYQIDYHQFTLFYYDMAGNLLKTVPPLGVDTFVYDTDNDGVRDTFPTRNDVKHHRMATTYAYNSVGQKIAEETPDGGKTQFWYNDLAQLRFSQNAKQLAHLKYSYLRYDDLSRIVEAGESYYANIDNLTANVNDQTYPSTYCTNTVKTVYDDEVSGLYYVNDTSILSQRYLQNRISYAYADNDLSVSGDEVYTYYSYDPHGNVEWMLQSIPGLDSKKYIAYEYDLISGKVTKVKYNEGKADQFFHRYTYDSDNRIEKVETSRDNYIWDTDAKYQYYAYGPLKRLSIGEDKIQGIDYVYTINGWLKAVNHQSLSATNDPGKDGASGSLYATDIYGNTLGYFEGDFKRKYKSGSTTSYSPFNSEFSDVSSPYYKTGVQQMDWYRPEMEERDATNASHLTYNKTDNSVNYRGLYNGTITNMVYNTKAGSGFINFADTAQGFKFNYDELYRITAANFDYYSGASTNAKTETKPWYKNANSSTAFNSYKSSYAYDINGNITSLSRYEASTTAIMDNLKYSYNKDGDGNQLNQLNSIKDLAGLTTNTSDLESQAVSNYGYNEMGQLQSDAAEKISLIKYTPSGKVDSVSYTDGKQLAFEYDAMGYKIAQKLYTSSSDAYPDRTYYVNDAKGNIMAVYKHNNEKDDNTLKLTEFPLYAADRMGECKPATPIDPTAALGSTYTRTVAEKYYEIKDHLGNVRAVVSDVKDNNKAIVQSATDYYPFGMAMPGRNYVGSSTYRFGYQGKERLDEMKTGGNAYDFGARILDPRVGRWLSLDPLAEKYPSMSPYCAMNNDPINMKDPDGKASSAVIIAVSIGAEAAGSLGIALEGGVGFVEGNLVIMETDDIVSIYFVRTNSMAASGGLGQAAKFDVGGVVSLGVGHVTATDGHDLEIGEVVGAIEGVDFTASADLSVAHVVGADLEVTASTSQGANWVDNEGIVATMLSVEGGFLAGEGGGVTGRIGLSQTEINGVTRLPLDIPVWLVNYFCPSFEWLLNSPKSAAAKKERKMEQERESLVFKPNVEGITIERNEWSDKEWKDKKKVMNELLNRKQPESDEE